ncbi:MAG: hypothetical protein ACRDPF_16090, partial [Streptosporangiaceae bacterium]
SRTRPMVRPSLSSSGRPLSLDVKTWRLVISGHHLLQPSGPAPLSLRRALPAQLARPGHGVTVRYWLY